MSTFYDFTATGIDGSVVPMEQERPGVAGATVRWNYTKFLISRAGRVLIRLAPTTTRERLRHSVSSALWV